MAKNYLLIYSEQLATDIELLCQNIKAPSNTLFQIRKSSSSIYANIREAKGEFNLHFTLSAKRKVLENADFPSALKDVLIFYIGLNKYEFA